MIHRPNMITTVTGPAQVLYGTRKTARHRNHYGSLLHQGHTRRIVGARKALKSDLTDAVQLFIRRSSRTADIVRDRRPASGAITPLGPSKDPPMGLPAQNDISALACRANRNQANAQIEPYTRATTRESCHCLCPVRVGEADDRERRPPMASGTRGDAKPIADVYGENGVHLTAAGKGPGSRIQGWQRWHSYLAEGPPARIIGRPDGRPAR